MLYGYNNIIRLPTYAESKKENKKIIIDTKKKLVNIQKNNNNINCVCQHLISWKNLLQIRKKFPNRFQKEFYYFSLKYIQTFQNEEVKNEFVCKSCGELLDIRNFVKGGSYDKNDRFIPNITPDNQVLINLEDDPIYSKYGLTILYIDRILEDISNNVGLFYFVGQKKIIKIRRRNLIKKQLIYYYLNIIVYNQFTMKE